mmetsp:Transcript_123833/g.246375  ORF Transcript_123833/g.246375 Transcript_123833/m.246375 type:complete len:364 (-) Transcript_123833:164-1255(-)
MASLCTVCVQSQSRYTCPRCQIAYCSLECYQKHSSRCTERFYQDQVENELHSQKATGMERKCLERIVQQLNNLGQDDVSDASDEDDTDEMDNGLTEDRLRELLAKAEADELTLQDLTEEEAQHFNAEIKNGSLGTALGSWQPWWQRAPVSELDSLDDYVVPPIPFHICCGAGRHASPLVALTIFEVLYAYAHMQRVFNGDLAWDSLQAASHLLHLAAALHGRVIYQNLRECMQAVQGAAVSLSISGGGGDEFHVLCLHDAACILRRGCDSILRALRETSDLLDDAVKEAAEQEDSRKAVGGMQRSKKKLEFLMSFAANHLTDIETLASQSQEFAEAEAQAVQSRAGPQDCRMHEGLWLPVKAL